MTDPATPPPPQKPTSATASRAALITAILAVLGLSIAAWVLAGTTESGDDDPAIPGAPGSPSPTATRPTPTLDLKVERYVALGDSMTSAPFLPEVDPAGGCYRSSQNYPSRLADWLRIPDFVDVSCGGATTSDMTSSQHDGVAPQLDAVTADTDLVTLTLGGNDFGIYRLVVQACALVAAREPGDSPCRDAANRNGSDTVFAKIDAVQPRLEAVLEEIHARAPDAQVVLIGYPRIFPTDGICPETLPFASGDYPYLDAAMQRLNETGRAAAAAAGAEFVDMYAASAGHDACSSNPWMNGATTVPDGAAKYHPFPEAQEAIAERVVDLLAG